jgi:putative endonuclease
MNLHSKNNVSQIAGQKGEEQATLFLKAKGYKILECNWHLKKYEIDVLAEFDNKLIVIEVKTRRTTDFGKPETFVSLKKQKFLISAVNAYVEEKRVEKEIRFDIVSVIYNNGNFFIDHIQDAFYPRLQ